MLERSSSVRVLLLYKSSRVVSKQASCVKEWCLEMGPNPVVRSSTGVWGCAPVFSGGKSSGDRVDQKFFV